MRHSRHFRFSFACFSLGMVASTILFGPGLCPAQVRGPTRMMRERDRLEYRPSSGEEERFSPAVQRLREALRLPVSKEDLTARKANLTKQSEQLRGVVELSQALMLHEWQVNELDENIAAVDRQVREDLGKRWIEMLREALKASDPERQLAAADYLSETGVSIRGTGGVSLAAALAADLAALVRGQNQIIDAAAARALGKIHPDLKVAVPVLERALQSRQVKEQRAAAAALTDLIQAAEQLSKPTERSDLAALIPRTEVGEVCERVVPVASRGLQDPDPEVRRGCVAALRQAAIILGDLVPLSSEAELKQATEPEREPRSLVPLCKALGEQAEGLARRLDDADPEVRLTAARTLEEMGNARARVLRVRAIPAAVPEERKEAKTSLPEEALYRGLRAAEPALAKSLSDSDLEVRLAAVEVFETLGSDVAASVAALTRALNDPDRFVRWAAARALSNIDPAQDPKAVAIAVPGLARVLFDPDLNTRIAAAATLEQYGFAAKEAVPAMARAVSAGDPDSRVAIIRALQAIDPADSQPAVPALGQALTHPDERVRRAAAEALGRIGPLARDAEPALHRALADRADQVRKAAAEALINLKAKN